MHGLSLLVSAVLCAADAMASPAASSPASSPPKRLLILQTQAVGVEPAVAETVNAQLAERVGAVAGYAPVSASDLDDVLALHGDREQMGCESDPACLARISKLSSTALVLTSSVGEVGANMVVTLALLDANNAAVLQRASETVAEPQQLLAVLSTLVPFVLGSSGELAAGAYRLEEGQQISFAVFELKPAGVADEVAKNVTQVISSALARIDGTKVISSEDVDAMLQLEEEKERMGCLNSMACIAEIGGALGVDKLVVGHAGTLGQSFVVSLRLIDPTAVKVDSRVTESFQGDPAQLIGASRHAVRRLLGLQTDEPGTVTVTCSEQEAALFVDSEPNGELPRPPVIGLAAGRHAVRIAKAGFLDWRSDVYVEPGLNTVLWADLNEEPARWYQKWWLWGSVATVAAAVVAAAVLLRDSDSTGTADVKVATPGGVL